MMSYNKNKKMSWGGGSDKHYIYYRKSDRKSYSSAILRQRLVALQVRVGWRQDGVFGDNKNHWEFFTQQMKEVEQLTVFVTLMQVHGILHLT